MGDLTVVPPLHLKNIRASRRNENEKPTVDGIKFATSTQLKCHTTNETQRSSCFNPRARQSSMLACAWRSRCCVIYVFLGTSLCDRFMQHNIEHKGQGEHNKWAAYGFCACTDVANFIPSTVSLNVVKDSDICIWKKCMCVRVRVWYVCLCARVRHARSNENWLIPLILTNPY